VHALAVLQTKSLEPETHHLYLSAGTYGMKVGMPSTTNRFSKIWGMVSIKSQACTRNPLGVLLGSLA